MADKDKLAEGIDKMTESFTAICDSARHANAFIDKLHAENPELVERVLKETIVEQGLVKGVTVETDTYETLMGILTIPIIPAKGVVSWLAIIALKRGFKVRHHSMPEGVCIGYFNGQLVYTDGSSAVGILDTESDGWSIL